MVDYLVAYSSIVIQVCIPASPKIEAWYKSEMAPFITFGCSSSVKSSVELTNPVNLIQDFTFDKSPLHNVTFLT